MGDERALAERLRMRAEARARHCTAGHPDGCTCIYAGAVADERAAADIVERHQALLDDHVAVEGVDYCTAHDGIRLEDAHYCDERDDATDDCPQCGGAGVVFLNEQDEVDCPKCDGDGTFAEECALTVLYRRRIAEAVEVSCG